MIQITSKLARCGARERFEEPEGGGKFSSRCSARVTGIRRKGVRNLGAEPIRRMKTLVHSSASDICGYTL